MTHPKGRAILQADNDIAVHQQQTKNRCCIGINRPNQAIDALLHVELRFRCNSNPIGLRTTKRCRWLHCVTYEMPRSVLTFCPQKKAVKESYLTTFKTFPGSVLQQSMHKGRQCKERIHKILTLNQSTNIKGRRVFSLDFKQTTL